MRIPKRVKIFCSFMMAFILTEIPSLATAQASRMIPTAVVAQELGRKDQQRELQEWFNRDKVKKELESRGVSADEAQNRLAQLSDTELNQLHGQMVKAKAGGDLLVAILLIVLIIYFVKRI